MKVAIHTIGHVTERGFTCLNHFRFWIVVGTNPVGPKGGRSGNWQSGRIVEGPLCKRAAAEKLVEKMVEEKGYEWV